MTCCNILLKSENHNINDILGFSDNLKFKSCLTLFMNVNPKNLIFKTLLDKYFLMVKNVLKPEIFKFVLVD